MTRRTLVTLVALVSSSLLVAAQGRAVPQTHRPMKIGVIGSGRQGGSIGLLWAKAGHEVMFSSRHPEELKDLVASAGPRARAALPQDAATFGDVVLVAVPYGSLPQVGHDYAPLMKGKIVIDCGNPYEDRDGAMAKDALAKGTAESSTQFLPGVRLVRAFNALTFIQVQREAHRAGELVAIPIAGDDAEAVRVVTELVTDAGFDPVVVGGLARAKEFDKDTPVYLKGLTARQLREALKLPSR
jgi:predicted dinucleotide-binding enzyme